MTIAPAKTSNSNKNKQKNQKKSHSSDATRNREVARIQKSTSLSLNTRRFLNSAIQAAYQDTLADIEGADDDTVGVLNELCNRWNNHLDTVQLPIHTNIAAPQNENDEIRNQCRNMEEILDQAIEQEKRSLEELRNSSTK